MTNSTKTKTPLRPVKKACPPRSPISPKVARELRIAFQEVVQDNDNVDAGVDNGVDSGVNSVYKPNHVAGPESLNVRFIAMSL